MKRRTAPQTLAEIRALLRAGRSISGVAPRDFKPCEEPNPDVDALQHHAALFVICPHCGEVHQHSVYPGHALAHCVDRGGRNLGYHISIVGRLD